MRDPLLKKIFGLVALVFLVFPGCSSPQVRDYQNEKPVFQPEQYFNGVVDIDGIVQDRSGKVTKRFSCIMTASWKDGIGRLDEKFTYSDGKTSQRIWTLKKTAPGKYSATAADVDGEAEGEISGNAFHLQYTLILDVDGKTYHVKMDDWMFQMNERVLLNRTTMTKFGFRVADVIITMTKR